MRIFGQVYSNSPDGLLAAFDDLDCKPHIVSIPLSRGYGCAS
jgi:hypothetical protein